MMRLVQDYCDRNGARVNPLPQEQLLKHQEVLDHKMRLYYRNHSHVIHRWGSSLSFNRVFC